MKPALLRTNVMFSKNPHCDMERQRRPESSGGQAIKLRILLEKARLYSFWFN